MSSLRACLFSLLYPFRKPKASASPLRSAHAMHFLPFHAKKLKKGLDAGKILRYNMQRWRGISAVGSAQHWQCWGQEFESPMLHHTVRTRTQFFTKKGSGTFFVYRRFCGGSMQNGKQERVKAGYHHSGVALPFILSICQKSHPINLLFLRSLL